MNHNFSNTSNLVCIFRFKAKGKLIYSTKPFIEKIYDQKEIDKMEQLVLVGEITAKGHAIYRLKNKEALFEVSNCHKNIIRLSHWY